MNSKRSKEPRRCFSKPKTTSANVQQASQYQQYSIDDAPSFGRVSLGLKSNKREIGSAIASKDGFSLAELIS